MAQRGSYAKGIAKREEIIERALEVIATEGYDGASVKRIADAVGLSQAGLLHYFDSKEDLFTEVLRTRDRRDTERLTTLPDSGATDLTDIRAIYVQAIRHNTRVPGLVELFSRLAAEAADPTHPAHEFFIERGALLREGFAGLDANRAGETTAVAAEEGRQLTPEMRARILQAVSDGLQLQWLLDPSVDMAEIVDRLFAALFPPSTPSPPRPE